MDIFEVVRSGDVDRTRQLLQGDKQLVGVKDALERRPLHVAAQVGSLPLTQLLLDFKARPNVKNRHKHTPLHHAIEKGHGEVARLLLEAGADLALLQEPKFAPLHGWLEGGNETAVLLMVELGADVNYVLHSYERRITPLHALAESEKTSLTPEARLRLTRVLLEHGADPNACDENEKTPLHAAAEQGHWGMLELLLDAGAELTARDRELGTALHYAVGSADLFAVELLLKRGADPAEPASDGKTPLDYARDFFGFRYVSELLSAQMRPPGMSTPEKSRPGELLCACKKGYVSLAERILGDDPSVIHTRGSVGLIDTASPLHLAAVYGQAEIARLLLAHGHPVDVVDEWGTTPLLDAVKGGHVEVVRALLEHGAQPNARDVHQNTALREAVYPRAGAAELVALLLAAGANPGALEDHSPTPLEEARGYLGQPHFAEFESELARAIALLEPAS